MVKRFFLLFFVSSVLIGCSTPMVSFNSSVTLTPSIVPAILQTQLAKPITTSTVDFISRESNDFLPSSTPAPSATPTNVFLSISDESGYDDLVITLERTMCFGTCPAYSLVLYGNGKGIYEGKYSVKVEGIREFVLTQNQIAELVKAFEVAHYFSFADYYSIPVTDMPSVSTSITFQGKSKQVGHYAWCLDYENIVIPEGQPKDAAPQALCDLESKIDEIVNVAQWTGK